MAISTLVPASPAWAGFGGTQVYTGIHGSAYPYVLYSDISSVGIPVTVLPENVAFSNSPDHTQVTITGTVGSAPVLPNVAVSVSVPTCVPSGLQQVTCLTMSPPVTAAPLLPGVIPWYGPYVDVSVLLTGGNNVVDGRALTMRFVVSLGTSPGGNVVYGGSADNEVDIVNGAPDTFYCNGPYNFVDADPVDTLIGC